MEKISLCVAGLSNGSDLRLIFRSILLIDVQSFFKISPFEIVRNSLVKDFFPLKVKDLTFQYTLLVKVYTETMGAFSAEYIPTMF